MSRLLAASDLVFAAIDGGVARVEEMHAAIARRPFAAVRGAGLPAGPVREVHDGVTALVYAAIRAATAVAGTVARAALRAVHDGSNEPPWADQAAGAIAGLVGDRLERQGSHLGVRMALRHDGGWLGRGRAALPGATGKVAVFLHGLCGTEHTWRFYGGRPYGARLHDDLGYTALFARYNSGLHVSENGQRLAALLEEVVADWPVAVDEIALVGHSMGGLVARSACHYGAAADRRWVRAVRHVVCLGSPHLGAPLEKLANAGAWALGLFAETRPLAAVLNTRSAGIKDLRFGYVVDDEWRDADPDAFLENRSRRVPCLESASHHFIAATISRSARHPVGRLLGDAMVRVPSAAGRPEWQRPSRWIGSTSHLRLLNDEQVYRLLRDCLDGG